MTLKSIAGTTLLAFAAAMPHSYSFAQVFPTKPVRIVVPQTPGGASDALARIVGQKLSEKWGQPVVIENRAVADDRAVVRAAARWCCQPVAGGSRW